MVIELLSRKPWRDRQRSICWQTLPLNIGNVLKQSFVNLLQHSCIVLYYAKSLQSCLTLGNVLDCTCQVPLSMIFSRQEYWSGLSRPPSGDLPNSGTESCLLCLLHWQMGSLPLAPPWNISKTIWQELRYLNIKLCSVTTGSVTLGKSINSSLWFTISLYKKWEDWGDSDSFKNNIIRLNNI